MEQVMDNINPTDKFMPNRQGELLEHCSGLMPACREAEREVRKRCIEILARVRNTPD